MTPVRVDDPDDPRLADYRALEALGHRPDPHHFIAESELVVERLLRSTWPVASVLTTASHCERLVPALATRPEVPVYVADQAVLRAAVGFNFHRGVAAIGLRPPVLRWNDMSPGTSLKNVPEDMLSEPCARPTYTVLLAQGLSDPANVGAIVRAARAFGVDLLLLDRAGADPLSRRAIRAAAGNVFAQASAGVGDLVAAVERLRRAGATVYAATPGPRSRPLGAVVRPARCVILVGSEGQGLPATLRAVSDEEVAIPMRPGVDSLGVAAATAILLYALAGAQGPGL
ncbi:TrmH family RNA methyltransferase [Nannocystis punicea]|uniref:RNA methyltransferase n=1 Tax=Nannocystis punicea TaxID=2995304 RepID=A0ABY7H4Z2_9BACT|nr:RNA methyltransferase [Nannocystis poenicansa]WAS94356.1 RNA methyltransferase [Nannocystis poenicansa]